MPLGLIDILRIFGFDCNRRSKLVRHQDRRYPIEELRRHRWLELYQSYQSRTVFQDAEQIVSFCALPGARACFYGVYEIRGKRPGAQGEVLDACDWSSEWRDKAAVFYELERDPRFDELRDRLIIDWGPGMRSWVQNLSNKPVLELLPPGRKLQPFDDYLEFTLTFAQLRDLFDNERAHRDWQASLSAVAGVYLILAERSGAQYVGSAYGQGGIWERWRQYARSGHGGNVKLKQLIEGDPAYPEGFRFSLLQILPKTMTQQEVLQWETLYKKKLGSRATGLNVN